MQIAMPGILLTKRNHRTRKKCISSEYTSGVPDIAVMDGWEDGWEIIGR